MIDIRCCYIFFSIVITIENFIPINQGGKTLANKSKRFQEQMVENPGPGTYSTEKYTDFRTSKSAPGSMQNKTSAAGSVSN